jgi:5-methylcytosine-specific restriction enzyme A
MRESPLHRHAGRHRPAWQPILEVDHVEDLARGGEDHPRNMVALCPNCHACKTRGSNPARWRRDLTRVATAAHKAAMRNG